ncbi:signal peptidase I [Streptacidiphilus sp. 4-A2]|nr:signal peptidase I [Streptacidiphilus sp. 4-A2]
METQEAHEDRESLPEPAEAGAPEEHSRSSAVSGLRTRLLGPGLPRDVALLAVVCALVLFLVNTLVAEPFGIPSGSMENTLKVGDRVVVDKLAYRFGGTPQRGDVIVFDGRGSFITPDSADPDAVSGDDFVKRVIGVGGDTVTCCDRQGRVSVDGVPLDESAYLFPGDAPSAVPFSVKVPPGTLFVLGDHRSVSSDSRNHLGDPGGGFVPVGKVIGRVEWVVYPVGDWRSVNRPQIFAVLESELRKGAARG